VTRVALPLRVDLWYRPRRIGAPGEPGAVEGEAASLDVRDHPPPGRKELVGLLARVHASLDPSLREVLVFPAPFEVWRHHDVERVIGRVDADWSAHERRL